VAHADGRLDEIERDETANYIHRQQLAPTISRERIAEFFDARARHLAGRDFGDLIADALRPVAALSLTFDVVRIAELVAAADRHVDPNEARVVRLLRLITMSSPEPRLVESPRDSERTPPCAYPHARAREIISFFAVIGDCPAPAQTGCWSGARTQKTLRRGMWEH
jgi:hypothetical protein